MKATIIFSLILLSPAMAMAQTAIDREIANAENDPNVQVVFSEKRDPATKKIIQESRVVIAATSAWEKRFRKAFNDERPNSVEASLTNQGVYYLTFKTADRESTYAFVPSNPGCVVSVSTNAASKGKQNSQISVSYFDSQEWADSQDQIKKGQADTKSTQKEAIAADRKAIKASREADKQRIKAERDAQRAAVKAHKEAKKAAKKETARYPRTIQGSTQSSAASSGIHAIRTDMPRVDRIPDVTAKLRQRNPGSTIQYTDWVKYRTVMGTIVVAPGETIFVPSNLSPRL
ncbi:MAG: DUF5024 domain-containing protein [Bacteroidales bacterium]|nr:DUF5024 domain-containing protein [Bacteroidales bacterium]